LDYLQSRSIKRIKNEVGGNVRNTHGDTKDKEGKKRCWEEREEEVSGG